MSIQRSGRRVNSPRVYDASTRRRRAEEQRAATLEVAHRLFLEHGYAATTVALIAGRAGISEATVYKTYGGKAGLVRALCGQALRGTGTIPAEERSEALRAASDGRVVIEGWAALAREVAPRVAPLQLLLRDVARSDPEAAALLAEVELARSERMTANALALHDAGHLRQGVSLQEAADVLWTITVPELFDALVTRRGWSLDRYADFIARAMTAALL